MAKRRKNSEEGVSLFSFMSILACLIGILTLMISVSMQLKQIENEGRSDAEKKQAIENRDLTKKAEKIEENLKKITEKLERENAASAELAKLEEHKIILRKELESLDEAKPEETDAELQKLIERMRNEIVILKKGRPPLSKRLEELKAELAKRKNPPKPVESVVIKPGGTGISAASKLFFVECNSTGIVIMSGKGAPITVSLAAIPESTDYNQFLSDVKQTRDSMVLFLIRKSGNSAYAWAAGVAESKYEVLTGKLPIPNDGKIDLSLFQ